MERDAEGWELGQWGSERTKAPLIPPSIVLPAEAPPFAAVWEDIVLGVVGGLGLGWRLGCLGYELSMVQEEASQVELSEGLGIGKGNCSER